VYSTSGQGEDDNSLAGEQVGTGDILPRERVGTRDGRVSHAGLEGGIGDTAANSDLETQNTYP
jgi:hypothetical protein